MGQINVKMLFVRYNENKANIEALKERIEEIETKATKITPGYSDNGGSSGFNSSSKVENNCIKVVDLQNKIDTLEWKIKEADRLLYMLKPYQRHLVTRCYIDGSSFSVVARQEKTTADNIKKILDLAIKNLNKKTGN